MIEISDNDKNLNRAIVVNNDDNDTNADIEDLLKKAQSAYKEDNSNAVSEYCEQIFSLDPENYEAWVLMAKFGGWDSQLYSFDLNYALRCAKHSLSLTEDSQKYVVATDIYTDRKHQLALRLDAALMMPSYQGSKEVHQIMMDWKNILVNLPNLSPALIQNEVNICSNLCLRSKMGVMPGDRLVYSAYATFNKKKPYNETFTEALASRIKREKMLEDQRISNSLKRIEELIKSNQELVKSGKLTSQEEGEIIRLNIGELRAQLEAIEANSEKKLYVDQLEELERQLLSVKPYKIFKKQMINSQIKTIQEKLKEISSEIELTVNPIKAQMQILEARLYEIEEVK